MHWSDYSFSSETICVASASGQMPLLHSSSINDFNFYLPYHPCSGFLLASKSSSMKKGSYLYCSLLWSKLYAVHFCCSSSCLPSSIFQKCIRKFSQLISFSTSLSTLRNIFPFLLPLQSVLRVGGETCAFSLSFWIIRNLFI